MLLTPALLEHLKQMKRKKTSGEKGIINVGQPCSNAGKCSSLMRKMEKAAAQFIRTLNQLNYPININLNALAITFGYA